jgi:hypothetical protein
VDAPFGDNDFMDRGRGRDKRTAVAPVKLLISWLRPSGHPISYAELQAAGTRDGVLHFGMSTSSSEIHLMRKLMSEHLSKLVIIRLDVFSRNYGN